MSLSLHDASIIGCITGFSKKTFHIRLINPLFVNCLSVVRFVFKPSGLSRTVSALCLLHSRFNLTLLRIFLSHFPSFSQVLNSRMSKFGNV